MAPRIIQSTTLQDLRLVYRKAFNQRGDEIVGDITPDVTSGDLQRRVNRVRPGVDNIWREFNNSLPDTTTRPTRQTARELARIERERYRLEKYGTYRRMVSEEISRIPRTEQGRRARARLTTQSNTIRKAQDTVIRGTNIRTTGDTLSVKKLPVFIDVPPDREPLRPKQPRRDLLNISEAEDAPDLVEVDSPDAIEDTNRVVADEDSIRCAIEQMAQQLRLQQRQAAARGAARSAGQRATERATRANRESLRIAQQANRLGVGTSRTLTVSALVTGKVVSRQTGAEVTISSVGTTAAITGTSAKMLDDILASNAIAEYNSANNRRRDQSGERVPTDPSQSEFVPPGTDLDVDPEEFVFNTEDFEVEYFESTGFLNTDVPC